ncbi:hypothetical protein C2S52_003200 [Perilla frutescens var. hirtella]|nr:hypothetical protein C2S51_012284 [Perilla frutescens var. frutescens]KAH6792723.1 hypothetical protein C2S52_003200 [Perilla frutescens var. hirtella]
MAKLLSLKQFALKETDASLEMVKHVISAHAQGKNLVMSPLSIHLLLAMTAAGSSGPTRSQLLTYLRSQSLEELTSLFSMIARAVLRDGSGRGGPLLSTKNGLWVDQRFTLKPVFRDIIHNSYKAVAEHVDFQNQSEEARQQVNAWAEKETNGLVKEIVPPDSINELTRLILANAIYFKGAWNQVFDASRTRHLDFYLLNGTPIQAPFMTSWCLQRVRAFNGFKVLQLPYKQGSDKRSFSMCIYLPDARDGLPALIERICSEPEFINGHLPSGVEWLDAFRIPKFKIGFEFEASDVLKGLGVVLPFLEKEDAGLAEMVDSETVLFVSRMRHKAFVEVNEEGTEAAAVTVEDEDMGCSFMEDEKPRLEFVADHPFLFLIREDTTGLLLFVGQLLNPLAD